MGNRLDLKKALVENIKKNGLQISKEVLDYFKTRRWRLADAKRQG